VSTLRIQLKNKRNAALWLDSLPSMYQVVLAQDAASEEAHAFDLCILDQGMFPELQEQILEWKSMVAPVFLPVLLLIEPDQPLHLEPHLWDVVDDILRMPVSRPELLGRIRVLLRARLATLELHELYAELHAQKAESITEAA
jgi:DNA-binding response OmpR family regulator